MRQRPHSYLAWYFLKNTIGCGMGLCHTIAVCYLEAMFSRSSPHICMLDKSRCSVCSIRVFARLAMRDCARYPAEVTILNTLRNCDDVHVRQSHIHTLVDSAHHSKGNRCDLCASVTCQENPKYSSDSVRIHHLRTPIDGWSSGVIPKTHNKVLYILVASPASLFCTCDALCSSYLAIPRRRAQNRLEALTKLPCRSAYGGPGPP